MQMKHDQFNIFSKTKNCHSNVEEIVSVYQPDSFIKAGKNPNKLVIPINIMRYHIAADPKFRFAEI